MCYVEQLNNAGAAAEERKDEYQDTIDQLVSVFLKSGITIGSEWFKADDADEYFYSSKEYSQWLAKAEESTESAREDLMREYEELKAASMREFVEQLERKLTDYLGNNPWETL